MRATLFIFAAGFALSSLIFLAGGITTAASVIGAVGVLSMVTGLLAAGDDDDDAEEN